MIVLYSTKFRVNRLVIRRDIAKRPFSIWRPWNHNLHLHTKFRWNRMISGWDIAIKHFSKWRPSAILNFRNSVFWSHYLC